MLHDAASQRRVVGLRDEMLHAVGGADDHRRYAERRRPSPTSTLVPPTCTRVMSLTRDREPDVDAARPSHLHALCAGDGGRG